jgi:hypothetical protein
MTPATLTPPQHPITPPTPEAHLFEHNPSHPGFITPAVIDRLNSVEGGPRWVGMVRNYMRLESQYRLRVSSYPPSAAYLL